MIKSLKSVKPRLNKSLSVPQFKGTQRTGKRSNRDSAMNMRTYNEPERPSHHPQINAYAGLLAGKMN